MVKNRSTLSLKIRLLTGCHVINKVSTKESAIKRERFLWELGEAVSSKWAWEYQGNIVKPEVVVVLSMCWYIKNILQN